MAKGYIRGELKSDLHETHHHVMPIAVYMKVFGALMVLTVVTILVSYADLGNASLPVAMFVALIKAGLVVGFFMHLRYDTRFHSFVFLSSLLFVGLFFLFTYVDINTRGDMVKDWDNMVMAHDEGMTTPPAPKLDESYAADHGEAATGQGAGADDKGAADKGADDKGADDKGAADKGAADKGADDKGEAKPAGEGGGDP